jgi:hypothetical protein
MKHAATPSQSIDPWKGDLAAQRLLAIAAPENGHVTYPGADNG